MTDSPERQCAYHIRWVTLSSVKYPIITQNENGPCPLLAILNLLILKGTIQLPPMQEIITAEQLMEYLGDCMLGAMPKDLTESAQLNYEQNMSDAMTILPKLQTGLDVNVRFTGVRDFEYTPECIVFDLLQIPLYHGWIVDPHEDSVVKAVGRLSYNQLVEKIINDKTSDDADKISQALLCEDFLETTASQLTVPGLSILTDTLKEAELAVLFRNNHFITLIKHKEQLYQLVTDQGFLTEHSVVWETLVNVEGDGSFTDGDFMINPPQLTKEQQISQDEQLARQIQMEEEMQASAAAERATPTATSPTSTSSPQSPQSQQADGSQPSRGGAGGPRTPHTPGSTHDRSSTSPTQSNGSRRSSSNCTII